MTFAVRSFRPRQGASDAHIPRGSVRSEQRRLGRKEPPPEGLRRIWPGTSLLVGHSPTGGGCSLLAPRPRPNWAQQTASNLRPGPLRSRWPENLHRTNSRSALVAVQIQLCAWSATLARTNKSSRPKVSEVFHSASFL